MSGGREFGYVVEPHGMDGGGGFLSEAGLRERAQAQGRVFGAGGEGVRIWAFWLWDFGIIRNMHFASTQK